MESPLAPLSFLADSLGPFRRLTSSLAPPPPSPTDAGAQAAAPLQSEEFHLFRSPSGRAAQNAASSREDPNASVSPELGVFPVPPPPLCARVGPRARAEDGGARVGAERPLWGALGV